jgi:hypothetical protein
LTVPASFIPSFNGSFLRVRSNFADSAREVITFRSQLSIGLEEAAVHLGKRRTGVAGLVKTGGIARTRHMLVWGRHNCCESLAKRAAAVDNSRLAENREHTGSHRMSAGRYADEFRVSPGEETFLA